MCGACPAPLASLRAQRSNPVPPATGAEAGLPRRCAPRNDEGSGPSSQLEALAEIKAAHVGIGDQSLRAARKQDLGIVDDAGAVHDIVRLGHIVIGDEDADVALLQFADELASV